MKASGKKAQKYSTRKTAAVSVSKEGSKMMAPDAVNNAQKNGTGSTRNVTGQSNSKHLKKKAPVATGAESKNDEGGEGLAKKDTIQYAFPSNEGRQIRIYQHIRNPLKYGEFACVDEKETKYIIRLEPMDRGKLKFVGDIIKEMSRLADDKKKEKNLKDSKDKENKDNKEKEIKESMEKEKEKEIKESKEKEKDSDEIPVIRFFEHGTHSSSNYILLSPYSILLVEVLKIVGQLTMPCAFNVALQCLDAIKLLHQAGYINRNIKPGTFSIGCGDQETKIMLTDFRLCRVHLEGAKKTVRPARKMVNYGGTARYASIAALRSKDQGRKDDIESWIYMFYELMDVENGLYWRTMPRCGTLIKEKENFKAHVLPNTYKNIPVEFKKIVDMVHGYSYDSLPDYAAIKDIVLKVAKEKEYDLSTCDWTGKINPTNSANAIQKALLRSIGNVCSGDDDFEFKAKKSERKKLVAKDSIKNGNFQWTVIEVLGSGGFGDVYKVYDDKSKLKKHYAMKTESDGGNKTMLRLKVEVQVMMSISEARKANPQNCKHFVEMVDRGKNDELRCKFIVMTLVGPSLDDIRKKYGYDLSIKETPYIIGVQSAEAIRDLHIVGYIHRDIKPANFAVGFGPQESTIFLLDFGIGRAYLDPNTKAHKAPRKKVKFIGTCRFASRACHYCLDQGRKDDLECWIYMMFDIFDPEDGIRWKSLKKDNVIHAKEGFFNNKLRNLYRTVPSDMKVLLEYVDKLRFQSTPDYEYIISYILSMADKAGYAITNMSNGSWIGNLKHKKMVTPRFGDSSSASYNSGSGDDDD